jgi:glycosyltransferase involved in cell wall biosynthesis
MSCDVSVVIPTYNSSGTLKRALDSVYRQSLLPREIIVVDDGSDDWEQSGRIAASYPRSISLGFIHLDTNQGVSVARNAGISAATGRYLAFLDSDDVWYPDKLAIQYELMNSNNLDFSMHQYRDDMNSLRWNTGDRQDVSSLALSSRSFSTLSSWTPLLRNDNTSTVMVLKQETLSYDKSLRRGEDFKLYMELLSGRGYSGAYIKCDLAGAFKSTIGVSGLSRDLRGMHRGRMLGLKKLLKAGNISTVQFLFGICTEMTKYPIRIVRVWFRRSSARQQLAEDAKYLRGK